jgi:hypothetical protein
MTTVEMAAEWAAARKRGLELRAVANGDDRAIDTQTVRTRRVRSDGTVEVGGIRFQRCGGGRRVIRRKRGGE